MEPKYISTSEASHLYGISEKTLGHWRSQKRGKRVVYRVVDPKASTRK